MSDVFITTDQVFRPEVTASSLTVDDGFMMEEIIIIINHCCVGVCVL